MMTLITSLMCGVGISMMGVPAYRRAATHITIDIVGKTLNQAYPPVTDDIELERLAETVH